MNLDQIYRHAIAPAMKLLPARLDSTRSDILLLAIGLQESRFEHRVQINGPARGFWQFEKGGGVKGVMGHPVTQPYIEPICAATGVNPPSLQHIYDSLASNDVLAAAFARMLLWTDPGPLPAIGEVEEAWQYYLRNWRPGKPHRKSWNALYAEAYDYVREAEVIL